MGIGWDGNLQEDVKCIFELELEEIAEFADEDENIFNMVWSHIIYLFKVHIAFLWSDIFNIKKDDSFSISVYFLVISCSSYAIPLANSIVFTFRVHFLLNFFNIKSAIWLSWL